MSEKEIVTTPAPELVQKEYDVDRFIEKRQEFIEKVNKIMVEGKDFHFIQNKKSMAKGGAEKIASIFGWTATFEKDKDSTEAFGDLPGLVCFVCKLWKDDKPVGEGRGAAILSKNAGDPNKTLKMAQKSAFIDAVIRSSGLSDFYTQDLEDMDPRNVQTKPATASRAIKPSPRQLDLIKTLVLDKGYTKEEVMELPFIKEAGGSLTGGRDGTASKLIDWLQKAPFKGEPEQPSEAEDSQLSEENQKIADSIDF